MTYRRARAADARSTWHNGYTAYSNGGTYSLPNIYYKFVKPTCTNATYGCWTLKIVTRHGCPTAVSVQFDEDSNGTQVGSAYGTSGALGPRERAVIEIDADRSNVPQGHIGSISCD